MCATSSKSKPAIVGGDAEARQRFAEAYASSLYRQARRRPPEDNEEPPAQTPQEAARLLISEAVEALQGTPTRTAAVNAFLIESLEAILYGQAADVAFGLRAAAGRTQLDDTAVAAILAHVERLRRQSKTPDAAESLATAKAQTLGDLAALSGRAYDASWLNKLWRSSSARTIEFLSDEELEALDDLSVVHPPEIPRRKIGFIIDGERSDA